MTAPEKLRRVVGYDPYTAKLQDRLGIDEKGLQVCLLIVSFSHWIANISELQRVLTCELEASARATAQKEARSASLRRRTTQKALDRLGIDVSGAKVDRLVGFSLRFVVVFLQ